MTKDTFDPLLVAAIAISIVGYCIGFEFATNKYQSSMSPLVIVINGQPYACKARGGIDRFTTVCYLASGASQPR